MGFPMDLEDNGKAIANVQWQAGTPLTNLALSSDLEKAPAKRVKRANK
jgi:hypothetical protein